MKVMVGMMPHKLFSRGDRGSVSATHAPIRYKFSDISQSAPETPVRWWSKLQKEDTLLGDPFPSDVWVSADCADVRVEVDTWQ
jgi:hypothetical protein